MKAWAMIAIIFGGLVAGLSGMCTLAVAVPSLIVQFTPHTRPLLWEGGGVAVLALIVGAPFIAGGVVLLVYGLRWADKPPKPRKGH